MRLTPAICTALLLLPACDTLEDLPPEDLVEDSEGAEQEVEPDATPALPAGFDSDIDPDALTGGGSWDSDRDVKVEWDNSICSGTLLRNDVVLTARHCITLNNHEDGVLVDLSELTVWQDGPGDSFSSVTTVTGLAEYPESGSSDEFIDVVLLQLSGSLPIDGRFWGESTEIYPGDESALKDELVVCQGYGQTSCEQEETPGFLNAGLVRIHPLAGDYPNDELLYVPFNGYLQSFGDSGSSCRTPVFVEPNRRRVLGVMSHGFPCAQPPSASEVAPNRFRSKVESTMDDWAGDFHDTFSSFVAYDDVSPPTTGYAPMWFTSGGELWQFYDGYEKNDATEEGTKYIASEEVLTHATIRVRVKTNDNDPFGLVARVRDDEHYYRLTIDDADNQARIYVRDGNVFQQLGAAANMTTNFTASAWNEIEFQVIGNSLRGYVNGVQVISRTDPNYTYMTGRAGLYTYRVSGARFDDFEIER